MAQAYPKVPQTETDTRRDGKRPPPVAEPRPEFEHLPHNLEAEQALIVALLQAPEGLAVVRGQLRPSDFYRHEHEAIFRAILDLADAGMPVNLITVAEELKRSGQAVGGVEGGIMSFLVLLMESSIATSDEKALTSLVNIILGASERRRIIHCASRLRAAAARGDQAEIDSSLGELQAIPNSQSYNMLGIRNVPVQVADLPEPPEREWIVGGLIPSDCLSVFFGDGGSFKSYTALALAVSIASGRPFLALATKAGSVLYVDTETDVEEFARRAFRISRGFGISKPPEGLFYFRLPGSLSDGRVTKIVAAHIRRLNPCLTILDSLSWGSYGVDLNDAGCVSAILRNLEEWGTVLAIDHCAKPAPGTSFAEYRPFGSTFKHVFARSVIQALRTEEGLILRPRKANYSELGEPIGVAFEFEGNAVRLCRVEAASLAGAEEVLPAREKVFAVLQRLGEATAEELSSELGLGDKTTRNYLTALKKAGKVESAGGKWRPIERIPNSQSIIRVRNLGILPDNQAEQSGVEDFDPFAEEPEETPPQEPDTVQQLLKAFPGSVILPAAKTNQESGSDESTSPWD